MPPSSLVIFVAFEKLSREKFAMYHWKPNATKQPFLPDVYHYIIRRKSGLIFHLLGMTTESTYARQQYITKLNRKRLSSPNQMNFCQSLPVNKS